MVKSVIWEGLFRKFIGLLDVPDTYIGQSGKLLAVNVTEDGIEFVAGGWPSAFTDLTDCPGSYDGQGGKFVKVKDTTDGLEFATVSAPAFTDLTDCPSDYTGYGGYVPKVKDTTDGLEFYDIAGALSGKMDATATLDDLYNNQSGAVRLITVDDKPVQFAVGTGADHKVQVTYSTGKAEFGYSSFGLPIVFTISNTYSPGSSLQLTTGGMTFGFGSYRASIAASSSDDNVLITTPFSGGGKLSGNQFQIGNTALSYFDVSVSTRFLVDTRFNDNYKLIFGTNPNDRMSIRYNTTSSSMEIVATTDLTIKDSYLSAGIALSQSGTTGLAGFTATSIVAALNELMSSKLGSTISSTVTVADDVQFKIGSTVRPLIMYRDTVNGKVMLEFDNDAKLQLKSTLSLAEFGRETSITSTNSIAISATNSASIGAGGKSISINSSQIDFSSANVNFGGGSTRKVAFDTNTPKSVYLYCDNANLYIKDAWLSGNGVPIGQGGTTALTSYGGGTSVVGVLNALISGKLNLSGGTLTGDLAFSAAANHSLSIAALGSGAGYNLTVQACNSGDSTGGHLYLKGGTGTGAVGGNVYLNPGTGSTKGKVIIDSVVQITGMNNDLEAGWNVKAGNDIYVGGGDIYIDYGGGSIEVDADVSSNGGPFDVKAGQGDTGGGDLRLYGGAAVTSGAGGNIYLYGGSGISSNGGIFVEGNFKINGYLGFFNNTPVTKTAVADQAAWANVSSGSDSVDLTDLNTKMQAIRDKLQDLLDALQSYNLV